METKFLNNTLSEQVQELFAQLQEPVEVLFFGQGSECENCDDTLGVLQELVMLSDKLGLSIYDLENDAAVAHQYRVDKAPGIVIAGRDGTQILDYGVRFAGIPSGHEFSSLVHDLILVSSRDSGLDQTTRRALAGLEKPVLLQVFVTPTCPYCPQAVVLAHRMALESPMVEAEMVEALEFPELSERYGVSGVPQTTINSGAGTLVGAAPEVYLLSEIEKALNA